MTLKQSAPPKNQRRFVNRWDELDYLCKKVRYWLYRQRRKDKAKRFAPRLEGTLRNLPATGTAILEEEGWALLYELQGDVRQAIVHRRRELEMMQQLHKEAASSRYSDSTLAYMLQDRNLADLNERQAILDRLVAESF